MRLKNISNGNRYAWMGNDGIFPPGCVRDVPPNQLAAVEAEMLKHPQRFDDFEETDEALTSLPEAFRTPEPPPTKPERPRAIKLSKGEAPPPPPKPKA